MDLIQVGAVSSINKEERTARVKFSDTETVSAPLVILKNSPLIKAISTNLTYVEKMNEPEKTASHTHEIELKHWMPEVGEMVLCLMLPNGGGDGYVIGGV